MPKKKEPTSTPVNKDPKKTTKPTTAAATATPAAPVTPAKAETPRPAASAASAATAKAETPRPAASAASAASAAPAKAEAPRPAASAASAAPAKAEAPKPAAKPASSTKATKAAKATATAKKSIDSTATVVVAKYDVGFGNKLFIRGEGAGLSWETGVEMKNVENDVWVWTNNDLKKGAVACKFLINDDVWSTGENLFVPAGETSTVFPNF